MSEDPVHGGSAERWGGWSWREPSRGEHFRRCSYCGSVHPEDVAEALSAPRTVKQAVSQRGRPEWADRKYGWPHKFYIDMPNLSPDRMFVVSAINYEPPELEKPRWTRVGRKERKLLKGSGWTGSDHKYVQLSSREYHHAKFYTVHLADPRVSDDVKEQVYRGCGLRFRFEDGKVRWSLYAPVDPA